VQLAQYSVLPAALGRAGSLTLHIMEVSEMGKYNVVFVGCVEVEADDEVSAREAALTELYKRTLHIPLSDMFSVGVAELETDPMRDAISEISAVLKACGFTEKLRARVPSPAAWFQRHGVIVAVECKRD